MATHMVRDEGTGRRTRWMHLAALATIGGLFATGCGAIAENVAEEAIERAAESESGEDIEIDFDFDDDEGSFTIETEEGTVEFSADDDGATAVFDSEDGSSEMTFGTDADRPDCIDSSFDVPDDFVAQSSMTGDGFCMYSGYVTSGSVDDYGDTYENVLKDLGFTDNFGRTSFSGEGMETVALSGQRSDGAYGSVTVSGQEQYYSANGDDPFPAIVFNFQLSA